MGCTRGKANPSNETRCRLYAGSAGFCQNPSCLGSLFIDTSRGFIHISEIAHIIAASDGGARGDGTLSKAARGSWENLILLCANCHLKVDKAEQDYPIQMLLNWKRTHREKIEQAFGIGPLHTRSDAFDRLSYYRDQNRAIFETYGPLTDSRLDPESEVPALWRRHVLETILPNNRAMLHLLERNTHLLTIDEKRVVQQYRIHVLDFEQRHVHGFSAVVGQRFPLEVDHLFCAMKDIHVFSAVGHRSPERR